MQQGSEAKAPSFDIWKDHSFFYLVMDGVRIARRGHVTNAWTWTALRPGVVVRDVPFMVEIDGVRVW